ncbi:translation initiation factor [Rheinheimera sp. MMS21-TC3]|nr:translation initiation factor [Rheinheimera sp. MMS21-TC3]WNO62296.1 translation initiation factor [Rheinheimera sp. MMS21-TC3]
MSNKKISLADWQAQNSNNLSAPQSTPADSNLVYTTDGGTISTDKADKPSGIAYPDGALRLRREKKGRAGKAVLTISGIVKSHAELVALTAKLKKKCACGGAVKDGVIEIQADKRELLEQLLQAEGYKTKWAGG